MGEKHGNAKLSEAKVALIREEYELGFTQCQLAERHGISQTHVSDLITGKAWRHSVEREVDEMFTDEPECRAVRHGRDSTCTCEDSRDE